LRLAKRASARDLCDSKGDYQASLSCIEELSQGTASLSWRTLEGARAAFERRANEASKKPAKKQAQTILLGDHSVSAPPDPISNSAVKPDRANGTNAQALE
ncbi:hypothetical protein KXV85_002614, partial [Aspergillus fumigatus]